jgi:DNA repair protein RadC
VQRHRRRQSAGSQWKLLMKYATRSLKVRSESGRLVEHADTVSTDFVRDAAVGLQSIPDSEILDAAFRILARRMAKGSVLTSPKDTQRYLILRFAELEHEVFAVVYLTKRHRVIACEELFRGTIDGASVHPRIVVKNSLRHNAAAVIVAHNHPSGIAEPSQADEIITQRLKAALELVDIRLLDHIVTAGDSAVSFAERGLL